MSDETRIADLEAIKALANLLGEHPRAVATHDCGGCQTEGYSLFTYYVHAARAVLAAGYVSPEQHRAEVDAALGDGAALLTNAMLRQDELQERAEKAEAKVARVEALAHRARLGTVSASDIRAALAEPERDEEGTDV